MGNLGCFPWGKPAAAKLSYPTYGTCRVFQCFHNPPNSDMDYRIFNVRTDVNACDCTWGCIDTKRRVCTESWLWEKNLLLHQGIEPVSTVRQSSALPTELHPHSSAFSVFSGKPVSLLGVPFKQVKLWPCQVHMPSPASALSKDNPHVPTIVKIRPWLLEILLATHAWAWMCTHTHTHTHTQTHTHTHTPQSGLILTSLCTFFSFLSMFEQLCWVQKQTPFPQIKRTTTSDLRFPIKISDCNTPISLSCSAICVLCRGNHLEIIPCH